MVTELFINCWAAQNGASKHVNPTRTVQDALRAAAARTAQTSKIYSISALACRNLQEIDSDILRPFNVQDIRSSILISAYAFLTLDSIRHIAQSSTFIGIIEWSTISFHCAQSVQSSHWPSHGSSAFLPSSWKACNNIGSICRSNGNDSNDEQLYELIWAVLWSSMSWGHVRHQTKCCDAWCQGCFSASAARNQVNATWQCFEPTFYINCTTLACVSAELQSRPITRLFDSCLIEFVCDNTIFILFVFSTKHDRMSSSTVFERITV